VTVLDFDHIEVSVYSVDRPPPPPYDCRMESKFFARVIGKLRIEADLTQEALAEKAGINRTTYGSIERGQRSVTPLNLAAGYRAHLESMIQVDREYRARMGIAPAEDGAPGPAPHAAIEPFIASLRVLLAGQFPAPGLTLATPAPKADAAPPETARDAPPRRRARASSRRKPPAR
jgi:DNA-binding XRE family transcriptional regulator